MVLTKIQTPPTIDEKLGEEEGTVREKNEALAQCRKYIGQVMWLTTCTRPKSSSKEPEDTDQQQDATASSSQQATKKKTVSESHEDWFNRVTKEGQEVLWHPKAAAKCPTLLQE